MAHETEEQNPQEPEAEAHPVRANILLVDDRPQNLVALEAILEPLGQRLVRAQSGTEALKHLLTQDFAVILLDVQMPVLDGFETAALIKQRERTRHVPIIFITAISTDAKYIFQGYSAGAVDYLAKPFDADILKSKVSVFVDLFHKGEQIKRQAEQLRQGALREAERRLADQDAQLEAARQAAAGTAEDLKNSEERYRSLVQATSQIVWTTPATGEFMGEQAAWCAFTGQTFREMRWWGWLNAIHPDDQAETLRVWREALESCDLFQLDHRLRRHDGEYRYMSVRAVPILESDGSVREWVGAHTDITERKQAEEEIARAREAAEAASRTKSQFLANMSHELRTPLNAVIGYSEMLQEEARDLNLDGFIPDLEQIRSAGRHLLSLINDVLDLSKIEAGRMDLFLETVSVPPLVGEAARAVHPLLEKNGNRLEVRCPDDLGLMQTDRTKLHQSLLNLLSNACKFTERGEITLEVGEEADGGEADGGGEWVTFRVSDTGVGMTEEQMARLFAPFSQVDASLTRRHGGTGLGLALTRRFCRMMGGDVSVESEPGRGSAFTIRLPKSTSEPSTKQEEAETGEAAVVQSSENNP